MSSRERQRSEVVTSEYFHLNAFLKISKGENNYLLSGRVCVSVCVSVRKRERASSFHSVHSCVGSQEDEAGKAPDAAAAHASSVTRL